MMMQRTSGYPHLASPYEGEGILHSAGPIQSHSPRHSSPFEGEARWGWGHTHRTNDIQSKEQSHG